MVFLFAILTSISFTATLIGVGSLVMGTVYRDRNLVYFGLKALLIVVVDVTLLGIMIWPYVKEVNGGLKLFAELLLSLFK